MIFRRIDSGDPRPHHYAGWSYYEIGDLEKTILYYRKALEIDPQYAKVLFNLAMLYLDHPDHAPANGRREAKELLRRAEEISLAHWEKEGESNPRVPYTLAILSAVKEDWTSCLDWLEIALNLAPWYSLRAENERWFQLIRDGGGDV